MTLRTVVVPAAQRRTVEELTADLDLTFGDRQSKRSAFWTMLVLSAVIASAGVLADSTATVIGAMIIAPLSTPIMGVALGLAKQRRGRSSRFVLGGSVLVVLVGLAFSTVLPAGYDLLENSQVTGRTSPGLLDVVAALATGFAGAVALARRDVAAVLPGVAIAISLVPPLAVVGICLGHGETSLAVGALLLFLSNLMAMVTAGTVVFAALGYGDLAATPGTDATPRRTYVAVSALLGLVAIPLVTNTLLTFAYYEWNAAVEDAATEWLADTEGAQVLSVDNEYLTFVVEIRTPGEPPPVSELMSALRGRVPGVVEIVVDGVVGEEIEAGRVGG